MLEQPQGDRVCSITRFESGRHKRSTAAESKRSVAKNYYSMAGYLFTIKSIIIQIILKF